MSAQRAAPAGRPEHVHLPRARAHTVRSLAQLRHATAAHERRGGVGPGPTPSELAAQLPCWHSRAHTLKLVDWLAGQPYVRDLCRAHEIAVDTWKANAVNDILDADTSTGRSMETSKAVAASRISRDEKQVQRAREVSVQLGIMVMYYGGRELTGAEHRQKRKDTPGSKQEGIPNAYAMGVCPPRQRRRISVPRPGQFAQVQANVHLSPCGYGSLFSHLPGPLTMSAAAASRAKEAPPAPPPRRRRPPGWLLANEMLAHPGLRLFTDVPARRLAGQLAPYHRGGWHGLELADVLIQSATAMGIDHTRPARNPYGALKALLSQVDQVADVVLSVPDPAPEPCRRPDCDGHGWIQAPPSASLVAWLRGENTVAKCPDCPPAMRASLTRNNELAEPPF